MENLNSFIQILLWIVLPILTLAVIVTVVLHYWRKHKEAKNPAAEFLEPPPVAFENTTSSVEPELNLTLENKDNTMNYTDEIEKNREIITHLKSEFSFLEKKYEELKTSQHNKNAGDTSGEKTAALNEMLQHSENKIASLSNELQQFKNTNGEYAHAIEQLKNEINVIKNTEHSAVHTDDSKAAELETKLKESELQLIILQEEMNDKLKIKEQAFLQLQLEKEKLLAETTELKQQAANVDSINNEMAQPAAHSNEEYDNLLKENEKLKSKVADYSYFDDLVNEKKQQISFLENQIEQRVRQVHDTEQNFYTEMKKVEMYGAQIASLKAEYDDTSTKLAEQIKQYDNQLLELDRLNRESQHQSNILNEKQHVINDLVNNLKLEKESTASLQQTITADKMTISQLTQQTEDQFRKIDELEGKLKISSQLLARIYTDLGKSFASIFSDDKNILLPENSKIKELSKEFNGVPEGEEVVFHS